MFNTAGRLKSASVLCKVFHFVTARC